MSHLDVVYWMVLIHLLYDFHWQGDFIGTLKGKYWLLMTVHAVTWGMLMTIPLAYFGLFAAWKLSWLMLSHGIIDTIKAKFIPEVCEYWMINEPDPLGWPLWMDQTLHALSIIPIFFM